MKWIGQHIYDLVARYRSDVYLDDISTGTIASGAHLGLDSNNKIVKAAVSSGGISFDGSTANGVLTYKDADEATVEQYLTFENSSNISTLGLMSNEDTGDVFKIATTTHGATTLTTMDDDAAAANLSLIVDGVFSVTTAGGRNNFFKADNSDDYFSINVGTDGATTISTTDAAGTAANLTVSPDGAFIVSSTGIDIASNGTITNATWNGDAIGTAYTDAKVTSIVAGDGIDVSGATGDVTVTAETATASNPGIVELATDGETTLATDSTKAVTPASLGVALTAHGLAAQTGKNYRIVNCNFRADIGTTKYYLPLKSQDEQTVLTREENQEVAVCDGRLVSITYRGEAFNTHSGDATVTFGVETNTVGSSYSGGYSVQETEAITVNNADDQHLWHVVFDSAKHWDSTDMFAISIQSDTDITGSNERIFLTLVIEDDWSTYLAGATREIDTTP